MNEKTYLDAVKLLTKKGYSAHELHLKLIGKGHSDENIKHCIEILKEKRFLNDQLFAEDLALHYLKKLYSPPMVKIKLKERGVELSDVELQAIAEKHELTEKWQIKELIKKKKSEGKRPDAIYRHLCGKGFEPELSASILEFDLHDSNNYLC